MHFVVHEHRGRQLHWDFRLEIDGVLVSWAVPKGPSMNPADRHLAVRVEDHPLEYGTFEGVIPEGRYGAGPVIVWDAGTYKLAEGTDPGAELKRGKLVIKLHGKKLRGLFSLVKMRGARYGDDSWLLLKNRDEFADDHWSIENYPQSVHSGRTLDELAPATARGRRRRAEKN
jgi:bifunctional non-homologous end joining protein LigD